VSPRAGVMPKRRSTQSVGKLRSPRGRRSLATHDVTRLPHAPYGVGRTAMFRAGWSPVGGGNGGHVKMAECLIFTRLLEIISNRPGENAGTPRRSPFSHVHAHIHGDVIWPDR